MRESYGFFPQMKAEGMAFKKEKSAAIVIGTNPGWQMGVLVVDESDKHNDEHIPSGKRERDHSIASGE